MELMHALGMPYAKIDTSTSLSDVPDTDSDTHP